MRRPRPIKLTEADKIRFWGKVDQRGPDECWEWQASCQPKGYGQFCIGNSMYHANRVAFVIINGNTKLHVLHHCNNPPCCNPNHLYAGTNKDNQRKSFAEGRAADKRGKRNGRAKLTEADVYAIRADGRSQRVIAKEYGIAHSTVGRICNGKLWKHI